MTTTTSHHESCGLCHGDHPGRTCPNELSEDERLALDLVNAMYEIWGLPGPPKTAFPSEQYKQSSMRFLAKARALLVPKPGKADVEGLARMLADDLNLMKIDVVPDDLKGVVESFLVCLGPRPAPPVDRDAIAKILRDGYDLYGRSWDRHANAIFVALGQMDPDERARWQENLDRCTAEVDRLRIDRDVAVRNTLTEIADKLHVMLNGSDGWSNDMTVAWNIVVAKRDACTSSAPSPATPPKSETPARWSWDRFGTSGMFRATDGEFVKFSDTATLRARVETAEWELAERNGQIEKLRAENDRLCSQQGELLTDAELHAIARQSVVLGSFGVAQKAAEAQRAKAKPAAVKESLTTAKPAAPVQAAQTGPWYLGSMNDGLFIINTPPRPSTDEVWHERPDGPSLVLNVAALTAERAQAIVDAHNRLMQEHPAAPGQGLPAVGEMVEAKIMQDLPLHKRPVCRIGDCQGRDAFWCEANDASTDNRDLDPKREVGPYFREEEGNFWRRIPQPPA